MNVALCDNDKSFLDKLKRKLLAFDCSIYCYQSSSQLIASNLSFDVAFLDIELDNDEKGFNLVKFLRAKNKKCIISFFTNYYQYSIQGYEYNAFRYILKSEPECLIDQYIQDVFLEFDRCNQKISGSYKNHEFNIYIDDIYYCEIYNHVVTFYTCIGQYKMYIKMSDLDNQLSKFNFFRCHRSYIVNLNYVFSIKNDSKFILCDGDNTEIPIGIRYKNSAKEKYFNTCSRGYNI